MEYNFNRPLFSGDLPAKYDPGFCHKINFACADTMFPFNGQPGNPFFYFYLNVMQKEQ